MDSEVIVTLLDGTKVAKSKVPAGTVYINEKGVKVRKVVKSAPVAPTAGVAGVAGGNDFLGKLKGLAGGKVTDILGNFDLNALGKIGGGKLEGVNMGSLTDTFKKLQTQIKGGNIKDITGVLSSLKAGGLDKNMLSKLTSGIADSKISNAMGLLGTLSNDDRSTDSKQAFEQYLKLAKADGVVGEDEYQTLQLLAKEAGMSDAELNRAIQ